MTHFNPHNIHSDDIEFSDSVKLSWHNNKTLLTLQDNITILGIDVPKDFITDGATIPKLFWNILYPFGKYFQSAVVHDYLCLWAKLNPNSTKCRLLADNYLSLSMKSQNIKLSKRIIINGAVRLYTLIDYVLLGKLSQKHAVEDYYLSMLENKHHVRVGLQKLSYKEVLANYKSQVKLYKQAI